jgi:hypothetical protein
MALEYETVMGKDKHEWVIQREFVARDGRKLRGKVALYRYDDKAPESGSKPDPQGKARFMLCGYFDDEETAKKQFPQAFGGQ